MKRQNQQKMQSRTDAQVYEGPAIFCWTKIGTEAGQPLDKILNRKEFERHSGGGLFAWGIGNSLGNAVEKAKPFCSPKAIKVFFTPMKSVAKRADVSPSKLLFWNSYIGRNGYAIDLPEHILITSKDNVGPKYKKNHYALLCYSDEKIVGNNADLMINAAWARNFSTLNQIGHSQVTSLVKYDKSFGKSINEYSVSFSADLAYEGFVKLCNPIELASEMLIIYKEIEMQKDHESWINLVKQLKWTVRKSKHRFYQVQLGINYKNA
ncbi:MAG: hypothetical protein LBK03_02160 [Bacteroidales bacterium]|jgi:hypothetical protein|nr:hypothetical protein [Bacteroidales bacterium]